MDREIDQETPSKENQVLTNNSKRNNKGKKRYWWKKKKKNKTLVSDDAEKEKKELFSLIPSDIISEILNRLEIKDVMRCKCVCKQWNALIQGQHFIEQHVNRRRKPICYSFSFHVTAGNCTADQAFQVIAANHGILVEGSNVNGIQKYRVRNPATRQVLYLPSPRFTTNHQISLCYDYTTNLYKLISIFYYEVNNRAGGCEILTLGSDDLSWRTLDIPSLHDLDHKRCKIWLNVQYQDGCTFHLMKIRSDLAQAVSINLEDESVYISTLPEGSFSNLEKVSDFCWAIFTEVVNKELRFVFDTEWDKITRKFMSAIVSSTCSLLTFKGMQAE